MKNYAKIEVELTCQFKTDLRNLTNFDSSTRNLKNLHFNRLILTKVNSVWTKKKYRGVIFDGPEHWCKIFKEQWLVLSKMTWGI